MIIQIKLIQACIRVCRFLSLQTEKIRTCLDGKNLETVLYDLGIRFHRVIYEHFQQFQYNSMGNYLRCILHFCSDETFIFTISCDLTGALCAICDVNEYKKCVNEFKVPAVMILFDTLHALCNLLLVLPENLKQVCTGDQLVIISVQFF